MNENLDLLKILRLCPRGSRFYLSVIGSEVEFVSVIDKFQYPIKVRDFKHGREFLITKNGRFFEDYLDGECVLFPSKDQRDWSKFKLPNEDVDSDDSNKQEVKYRPFKDVEECFEEMKKHNPFGWICNVNDGYNLIVFLNDDSILFDGSYVSYQEAFKRGYTFMDGSPFGIKEE